jgi:hypothetical protein
MPEIQRSTFMMHLWMKTAPWTSGVRKGCNDDSVPDVKKGISHNSFHKNRLSMRRYTS